MLTHFIRDGDTFVESEAGQSWRDVLKLIWTSEVEDPRQILLVNDEDGTVYDLIVSAAVELSARTFDERKTPVAVKTLCDRYGLDCWEREAEAYHTMARHPLSLGHSQFGLDAR